MPTVSSLDIRSMVRGLFTRPEKHFKGPTNANMYDVGLIKKPNHNAKKKKPTPTTTKTQRFTMHTLFILTIFNLQ